MCERLDALEAFERELRTNKGLSVRGSMFVVITDGFPNGSPQRFSEACARARQLERSGTFRMLGIGVEDADMDMLAELAPAPVKLATVESFAQFWGWVLTSVRQVSRSMPGEQVELPNPLVGPDNKDGFAVRW